MLMARNHVVLVAVVVCLFNMAEPAVAQFRPDNRSNFPSGPGFNPGRPGFPPSIPDLRRDEDNDQRMKYLHLAHSGARAAAHSFESQAVPRLPSYKVPPLPHEAPALGKSKGVLAGIAAAIAGFFGWLFGWK